jgi:two-component system chemotaxis sensor kinase CheA
VEERGTAPKEDELAELARAWREMSSALHRLIGGPGHAALEILRADFDDLERAVERRASHGELAALLAHLRAEPVTARLQRLADHAQGTARRLGKPELSIEIDVRSELRLPAERWASFWSALIHVVQNAVDHGVESADERTASGKPANGKLTLAARRESDGVRVVLEDDGRGIDWEQLRERARAHGLAHETNADLVTALFADGISTARAVTQVSGRGVGMAAVRAAAEELGGQVQVESAPGSGTSVSFWFPEKGSSEVVAVSAPSLPALN